MFNRTRALKLALAAIGGAMCMLISDNSSSLRQFNLITTADARVGRPLTPVSVAGVARRSARRTVRHGVYYGAAYTGARSYYARGCPRCY